MLKLVSASKTGNQDSFAVFDGDYCVGHIMRTPKCPRGKPWFWTIFVSAEHGGTVDRGYATTREQAMADLDARDSVSRRHRKSKSLGDHTAETFDSILMQLPNKAQGFS